MTHCDIDWPCLRGGGGGQGGCVHTRPTRLARQLIQEPRPGVCLGITCLRKGRRDPT